MRRVLVDVDTQFDFVDARGALYVPAPDGVTAAIEAALAQALRDGDPIVGSVDSHAWDAWEFADNGGPFPAHCIKGRAGWLRVHPELPPRTRFVPLQTLPQGRLANLVGEAVQGQGTRVYAAADLAREACEGVGVYFEKEVYSMFENPAAEPVIAALVERLGGPTAVVFDVVGYCTGGYCVDAAARGLAERGYTVRVLAGATAAIGGPAGADKSERELTGQGVQWLQG